MTHNHVFQPTSLAFGLIQALVRTGEFRMTMTLSLRKFALTAHVTASVGLLGSIAAFLASSHSTPLLVCWCC